ncbi:hypothetical protein [Streptomyces cyaneogriseus]|uniref:hypothetical protein n=1 Tax=Streptomyces cyaneogriseus TaxID=68192 RepID=UPI000ADD4031|nr:hypothetical protein [Streptomyces cyaneogriseus]
MRILIAAAGSRGDVAPYTGLGAALRRAGYDVALAATRITSYNVCYTKLLRARHEGGAAGFEEDR